MATLKEKCLITIIDNFKQLHTSYTSVKSFSDKRKFEFLQRKYSFELAEKLYEKECLGPEYVDFVINRYLKSLDTDWLKGCEWEVVCKKISEIGPSLEKIYFKNDDHPWGELICHLVNVQFVSFFECNDSCLVSIAKFCPKIQSIAVNFAQFSSVGLKVLCCQNDGVYPCPDLRKILIGHSETIQDEDIAYLIKKLPYLENLEYDHLPKVLYSVHKNDIHTLDQIKPYNLTNLDLIYLDPHHSNFNDLLKICVSVCPNIKSFSCPVLTEAHLNLCSKFSQLRRLELNNYAELPLDINNFLRLKGNSLTSLKIRNFSVLISTLLQNCPQLHVLNVDRISFLYSESDHIPVLYSLKDLAFKNLNLIDTLCSQAMISVLSSCPNLKMLSFLNCELLLPEIQAATLNCCKIGKLQYINLSESSVESKFVQDILITCSSLTSLNLAYSDLSLQPEEMERLENVAITLPNKPVILRQEENSDYSDYDDFMNEYDDFVHTDDDDYDNEEDYDYYDMDDLVGYDGVDSDDASE